MSFGTSTGAHLFMNSLGPLSVHQYKRILYRRLKTHFYWRFSAPPALEASRNGTFLQAVTENRLWKCISTGSSVMPTSCRNLFPENRKSVFKNAKKKILIQGRPIGYSPARLRRSRKSRFFRVKSRASRPVGFDGCTDRVELVSIAPNSILYTVPNSIGVKVTNELS